MHFRSFLYRASMVAGLRQSKQLRQKQIKTGAFISLLEAQAGRTGWLASSPITVDHGRIL